MLQSKQPILSAAGKRGIVYAAAYLLVVATLVMAPFMLAGRLKADLSEQQDMLSLLKKRVEKAANSSAAGSFDKVEVTRLLVPGTTAGISAAEMQRLVANLAEAAGLAINRMQSVNITQSGSAVVLPLELEATGKIKNLQQFLYAVESGKPFILVKDANISVASPEPPDASAGADELSIRMTLEATGWMGGT